MPEVSRHSAFRCSVVGQQRYVVVDVLEYLLRAENVLAEFEPSLGERFGVARVFPEPLIPVVPRRVVAEPGRETPAVRDPRAGVLGAAEGAVVIPDRSHVHEPFAVLVKERAQGVAVDVPPHLDQQLMVDKGPDVEVLRVAVLRVGEILAGESFLHFVEVTLHPILLEVRELVRLWVDVD